ncbi:hypothetical protein N7539_002412 [Penicillium diatomitis]|uniref:Uncharacterized protein n=1 Tax=Penicillium diatomitis TaxID=2819901 RepID=A0A9W9XEL8_9EURO|nr:uncharacterized protein N7539_002412 [Penicillium diatomitis]KAJ5490845.1 hypothetical protein N7539_002412 [Penicillium diatomitis]
MHRTGQSHQPSRPCQGSSLSIEDSDFSENHRLAPTSTEPPGAARVQTRTSAWKEEDGFEPFLDYTIEWEFDEDESGESFNGLDLSSFRMEAVPPYPKHKVAGDSLASLYDQIYPCTTQMQRQSLSRAQTHASCSGDRLRIYIDPRGEGPFLPLPLLSDPVPEPSAPTPLPTPLAGSSSSTASSGSEPKSEHNIGKLIANKVHRAAAHGAEKYRKIRRKLSRD